MREATRIVAALLLMSSTAVRAEETEKAKASPKSLLGEPAPRFVLRTLNPDVAGPRYVLRDHVGETARFAKKRVLLDFAASWCVPCKAELKALLALAKPLEEAGVGVAVVVIDDTPEGIETMKKLTSEELDLPFPVASDRFQVLARRYHIGTLPASIVIDEAGIVRHVQEGYTEESMKGLLVALGLER